MKQWRSILEDMQVFISRKSDQSLEQLVQRMNLHPVVTEFHSRYPDADKEMIDRSLSAIYQAVVEYDQCQRCPGLDLCPNLVQGYQSTLSYNGYMIENGLYKCRHLRLKEEQRDRESLINSHFVPNEILEATFKTIERDGERMDAILAVMNFCNNCEPGKNDIGLYLHGSFGVGKSRIMAAAARKLAERHIASLMIYVPDFFREVKESIGENSVGKKIEALKTVPVLILDDIGAEMMSAWARDEVLGAILQYRVSEKLPTLFTSNYNFDELEEHLSYSFKSGMEELKAKRIMERIRFFTVSYHVGGVNRRKARLVGQT